MVEVFCFGGLGNQMFQYVYLLNVLKCGSDAVLNISDFSVHNHHNGFELKKAFGIEDRIKVSKPQGIDYNSIFSRLIYKICKTRLIKRREYHENYEFFSIPEQIIERDITVYGYWQNRKYVENVKDEVIAAFQFTKMDRKNELFLTEIENRNSVAVHVRRGDYLKDQEFGSVCDEFYYKNAIKTIKDKIDEPYFVFFSDDIEWCRMVFGKEKGTFVDWNLGRNSFRDMQLMSMCKNCIIANSTFSWWGAYLNQNKDKIVVAPKYWYSNSRHNYLVLEDWIAI